MGFKPERRVYKLVFSDPDFEGLIVRARSASVKEFLSITDMAGAAKDDSAGQSMRDLFSTFSKMIISWNVEDAGDHPIEPTLDALMEQDFGFVMKIITAWIEAVGDVPAPLDNNSTNGAKHLEVSLPMETLSPSLTS